MKDFQERREAAVSDGPDSREAAVSDGPDTFPWNF